MTYSTLLVHLELGQTNAGLLQAAKQLAERFGAGLVGIVAAQPVQIVYEDGYAYTDLIEQDRVAIATDTAVAEAEFRDALGVRDRHLEWRASVQVTSLSDQLAQEARCADLILTGAASGNASNGTRRMSTGDLVMQAGRPVMVVPSALQALVMDRMVVGWQDTREARRAVVDALPLLRIAAHVDLVEITPKAGLLAAQARLDDVAAWLKRHGVAAGCMALPSDGEDAAQLAAAADDAHAGIVVAGAYGHSRVREWALGGMTRSLLGSASRCSFMSH